MTTIENTIDIAAKPGEVWAILTDFPRYGSWNPFIPSIEGSARAGETITVHVGLGAAAVPIKAEIVTFRVEQELVWRSKLIAPGLFDRDHIFRIEPIAEGCRLRQMQTFSGPIAPMAGMLTSEVVRHGLKNMNEALKRRAEANGAAKPL